MNSHEIEQNVKRIMENFSKENFLYDLLLAYGISKTSITRLKSGDFNLSKVESEILYKKKIFFKQQPADKLLSSIESLAKEERIVKHSPRFAVVTDYKNLVAKDLKLGAHLFTQPPYSTYSTTNLSIALGFARLWQKRKYLVFFLGGLSLSLF